jgi:hypothetical protein
MASSIFEFGGPQFGLDDSKIAVLNTDGSYDAALDVPSVQMLGANIQTVNAMLEGDDQITDTHAITISGEIKLRFGSIPFAVVQALMGRDYVQSHAANSTDRVWTQKIGNEKLPYFGLCGRALSTQDDGDTHLFIPKLKIMQGFEIGFQYGQYVIPELTCAAVRHPDWDAIAILIKHEVAVAVTLPPNTGAVA